MYFDFKYEWLYFKVMFLYVTHEWIAFIYEKVVNYYMRVLDEMESYISR